ncbi:hypothetical protein MNEG_7320 [Monoraphidium neglectum]|uniref:Uncharacterized protein n=1 Tax=Monoraphidium neglectum TaxID=145388 RepID=A0A0D2MBP6_9CHLO|nr:hypothetical protein MNEG_7320 [Monoraphidium neglectum]KIZ00640.1 hypothetical protein MNEG_7320 [Monoraphidium neglectum]|eukprot:XP_013899659.1 hypothetical protein MNEG_7320 [Monoraphidium neglectum]
MQAPIEPPAQLVVLAAGAAGDKEPEEELLKPRQRGRRGKGALRRCCKEAKKRRREKLRAAKALGVAEVPIPKKSAKAEKAERQAAAEAAAAAAYKKSIIEFLRTKPRPVLLDIVGNSVARPEGAMVLRPLKFLKQHRDDFVVEMRGQLCYVSLR